MTTPADQEARALLIKKLLHKAEAKGTTPAEREAFSAKATALMIQWSIDDATLAGVDPARIEKIVRRVIEIDVPASYSYEYVGIGMAVAEALGCRGFYLSSYRSARTKLVIVGYESDLDRVMQLTQSLVVQCTLDLGPWYRSQVERYPWMTGTDKFQAKKSFILGFRRGVAAKLQAVKKEVVASAEPGTDLVLVDRSARVDAWVSSELKVSDGRARTYRSGSGRAAGFAAGQRADVGQGSMGGGRTAVGR
jgi:uncharacterized protein DUF2786